MSSLLSRRISRMASAWKQRRRGSTAATPAKSLSQEKRGLKCPDIQILKRTEGNIAAGNMGKGFGEGDVEVAEPRSVYARLVNDGGHG